MLKLRAFDSVTKRFRWINAPRRIGPFSVVFDMEGIETGVFVGPVLPEGTTIYRAWFVPTENWGTEAPPLYADISIASPDNIGQIMALIEYSAASIPISDPSSVAFGECLSPLTVPPNVAIAREDVRLVFYTVATPDQGEGDVYALIQDPA